MCLKSQTNYLLGPRNNLSSSELWICDCKTYTTSEYVLFILEVKPWCSATYQRRHGYTGNWKVKTGAVIFAVATMHVESCQNTLQCKLRTPEAKNGLQHWWPVCDREIFNTWSLGARTTSSWRPFGPLFGSFNNFTEKSQFIWEKIFCIEIQKHCQRHNGPRV